MTIRLTYSSIDGARRSRTFKPTEQGRKAARAWAVEWVGPHPEFGQSYAVSGDGVGKITAVGISLPDLFDPARSWGGPPSGRRPASLGPHAED